MVQEFNEKVIEVAGPAFSCHLTPWEMRLQKIYSKRVLCFSTPKADSEFITEILISALQATVNQIPTLAGEIVPLPHEQGEQDDRQTIKASNAILKIRDLTHLLDCEALRQNKFPQSWLKDELVVPIPAREDPSKPIHSLTMGAHFIRGGLLLVFCIHHAVLDGMGMTKAIEVFAENCCGVQEALQRGASFSPQPLDPALLDRSPICGDFGKSKMEDHPFMHQSKSKWQDPNVIPDYVDTINHTVVCQAFQLSAQSQKCLKAETLSQMANMGKDSFITTHDAIVALMFIANCEARYAEGLIKENAQVELYFPVSMRQKLQPPLPSGALYNCLYITNARISLQDALGPNSLGIMALAIRAAINNVTPERYFDCTALLQSTPKVHDIALAFTEDILGKTAFITSYNKFNIYSIKWPSAFGTFERFRLPAGGVVNGMHVVYPAQPDGSSDIALTLDKEVMDHIKDQKLWKKYTEPIEKEIIQ